MKKQLFDVLMKVGERLNTADAVWAVGASLMLNNYGLCEGPNDIDIFVKTQDIDKVILAIDSLGESVKKEPNSSYTSDYFYKYKIDQIGIDLISGFTINTGDGKYRYDFSEKSIGDSVDFNGIKIPFCSLEDWIDLYSVMPGGQKKAELIRNYMKKV